MTQDLSPKEIQLLVEERALAIAKAAELPAVKAEEKLDPWFVIDRLRRNRVGDADLFVTLFRGRYAYVPEWDKWLYWSGHHWDIDLLSRRALAGIAPRMRSASCPVVWMGACTTWAPEFLIRPT